ncbi:hypothetical protein FB451DRAFT_1121347 [Mycena latifolia]|nr:hypothetical protein FB451DRAFT_1121347 [Mycena latifolia]
MSSPPRLPIPSNARPPPRWSRRAQNTTPTEDPALGGDDTLLKTRFLQKTTERRDIWLGCNIFPAARAHWFLFIPCAPSSGLSYLGKIIQVTGNPHTGFGLQTKRNYDTRADAPEDTRFLYLGALPGECVVDGYVPSPARGPEIHTTDEVVAGDVVEELARALGLPRRAEGAPLPPPGDPVWERPHPSFERCQEWTTRLVEDLVKQGLLPESATLVMGSAMSFGGGRAV